MRGSSRQPKILLVDPLVTDTFLPMGVWPFKISINGSWLGYSVWGSHPIEKLQYLDLPIWALVGITVSCGYLCLQMSSSPALQGKDKKGLPRIH